MNVRQLSKVLVLVAAVLGVIIVLGTIAAPKSGDSIQNTRTTSSNSGVPLGNGAKATATELPHLTAEQREVLTAPGASASPAEQKVHDELIIKNARTAEYLSIGPGCKPDPLVIQITVGASLRIKNTDSEPHTLVFDAKHVLSIATSSSEELKTDFLKVGGAYGYGCDGVLGAAGIIVVAG